MMMMDYISLLSLLLAFFLSILFFFVIFNKHRSRQCSGINAPPGSMGYPVIGESLAFMAAAWRGHPEKFVLERMNKLGSTIFKTSILGVKTAVFCGPSCNKFLFSSENKLVVVWWPDSVYKIFPSTGQTSSIEEAKKLKKLLPQFLNPEALRGYVEVMDSIADKHFSSFWENKDQVVVCPLSKNYTFSLACRLFVGFEEPEKLSKLSNPFNALASGILSFPINFPGTAFNRAIKASKEIRKELKAIIQKREVDLAEGGATPTQDILSHMLVTCDEKGQFMNESEIADKILVMLLGGHDTASSVCTSIVKFLAQFPQVYNFVYQEQMEIAKSKGEGESLKWKDIQKMRYSWNVACEAMRLAPPLQGAFRHVIQDFSFHGFSIPKNWKVYWSANSTHQNPDYFADPYKFDPTRFEGKGPAPFTFVPFGGGPRMCPGREYARLEILVFMHHLVKRFRWEMVIPGEKMTFNPMPTPSKGLPIRLLPHKIPT